ncbi:hypothetical protein GGS20DRAFT_569148 [Poronia punctata]|nr:hypothetical protein GGS20DRAFT_569148 [Poronia punctata]
MRSPPIALTVSVVALVNVRGMGSWWLGKRVRIRQSSFDIGRCPGRKPRACKFTLDYYIRRHTCDSLARARHHQPEHRPGQNAGSATSLLHQDYRGPFLYI